MLWLWTGYDADKVLHYWKPLSCPSGEQDHLDTIQLLSVPLTFSLRKATLTLNYLHVHYFIFFLVLYVIQESYFLIYTSYLYFPLIVHCQFVYINFTVRKETTKKQNKSNSWDGFMWDLPGVTVLMGSFYVSTTTTYSWCGFTWVASRIHSAFSTHKFGCYKERFYVSW